MEMFPQAQYPTDNELTRLRHTHIFQMGGFAARWGMQTTEAFQQEIRAILHEVGFTTEQFLSYDAAGDVFGHPDQVELDVIIKHDNLIVVEIKPFLDWENTYMFDRKVAFYTRSTSRQVDRQLIVTPFIDNCAKEISLRLLVVWCGTIFMIPLVIAMPMIRLHETVARQVTVCIRQVEA